VLPNEEKGDGVAEVLKQARATRASADQFIQNEAQLNKPVAAARKLQL
jgi:hypothetical protein